MYGVLIVLLQLASSHPPRWPPPCSPVHMTCTDVQECTTAICQNAHHSTNGTAGVCSSTSCTAVSPPCQNTYGSTNTHANWRLHELQAPPSLSLSSSPLSAIANATACDQMPTAAHTARVCTCMERSPPASSKANGLDEVHGHVRNCKRMQAPASYTLPRQMAYRQYKGTCTTAKRGTHRQLILFKDKWHVGGTRARAQLRKRHAQASHTLPRQVWHIGITRDVRNCKRSPPTTPSDLYTSKKSLGM